MALFGVYTLRRSASSRYAVNAIVCVFAVRLYRLTCIYCAVKLYIDYCVYTNLIYSCLCKPAVVLATPPYYPQAIVIGAMVPWVPTKTRLESRTQTFKPHCVSIAFAGGVCHSLSFRGGASRRRERGDARLPAWLGGDRRRAEDAAADLPAPAVPHPENGPAAALDDPELRPAPYLPTRPAGPVNYKL